MIVAGAAGCSRWEKERVGGGGGQWPRAGVGGGSTVAGGRWAEQGAA